MSSPVTITSANLGEVLSQLDVNTRGILERIVADELNNVEEALRGPDPRSPGIGGEPGVFRGVQSPLAPGSGLVPINTGRLLASFEAIQSSTSAILTTDAQSPKGGFFYAEVAHHAGGAPGETVDLVTQEWEAFGQRVADRFEEEVQAALS